MSFFDSLIVVSFILSLFFILFSDFLYKKLVSCLAELKELRRFKEEASNLIKDLKEIVYEYRIITAQTTENQNNLNHNFEKLENSFRTLKKTAAEIQSTQQTKKAMLDFMKG